MSRAVIASGLLAALMIAACGDDDDGNFADCPDFAHTCPSHCRHLEAIPVDRDSTCRGPAVTVTCKAPDTVSEDAPCLLHGDEIYVGSSALERYGFTPCPVELRDRLQMGGLCQ